MPFNLVARVKNMTRETKLGLVVSCSFLCLLGVVVGLKMTEPPEEESSTEVAAAAGVPPPPPPGPPGEGGGKHAPPESTEKSRPRETQEPQPLPPLPATTIQLTGSTTPPTPAPPAGGTGSKFTADPNSKKNDGRAAEIDLPGLPPPAQGESVAGGNSAKGDGNKGSGSTGGQTGARVAAPPPGAGGKLFRPSGWGAVLARAADAKKAPATTGRPGERAANPALASAGGAVRTGPAAGGGSQPTERPLPPLPDVAPAAPAGPMVPDVTPELGPQEQKPIRATGQTGGTAGANPMTVAPLAKAGETKSGTAGGSAGGATPPALPPPPGEKKETNPPPPLDDLPPVPGAGNSGSPPAPPPLPPVPTAPPPPTDKKDTGLSAAGTTGTIGTKGTGGAATGKPQEDIPTIDIGKVDAGAAGEQSVPVGGTSRLVPTPVVTPTSPAVTRTGTGGAPTKAPDPIHVGLTPTASVPPLSVPPSPAVAVRAARPDVITYTEETYVANPGDNFKSLSVAKYGTDKYAAALYHFNRSHPLAEDELPEDGSLKPRQKVYVPPPEVLENRYPDQIKGSVPSPAPKPTVTVGSSPQPKAAPAPLTYRVAASGEFEYEIARKLLGDGERWMEIHNLNPGWDPVRPVPAGTTIKLPADAHLP